MEYKPTIGLEVHTELKTRTKMFCNSANDPNETHPNVNICPVCAGHPGTLPVINKEAVEMVILTGLALNCGIAENSFFERKNYFYPDLPKGYQISQYQKPLCENGYLNINAGGNSKKVHIRRIHLEEDTGRLIHSSDGKYSLVDFNRAGVPLMELVTEPDLENGAEVKKFAEELRLIFRYLNISDADMEKGQYRVEVNLSLARTDADNTPTNADNISVDPRTNQRKSALIMGTKVEIKNLNSIKAASDAVDYEIKRQAEILDSGKKVIQETRGWDENKKETFSQRLKEESQDYRYFPEPDLPPLTQLSAISSQLSAKLPELPQQRRERFKQYGLTLDQIEIFTVSKHLGDYYEKVASELDAASKVEHLTKGYKGEAPAGEKHLPARLHSLSANYIITEFPALFNTRGEEIDDVRGIKISPEAFAELMVVIFHEKISSTSAKVVLKEMAETGLHPEQIIKEKDLAQVSDVSEIEKAAIEVIKENSKPAGDFKKGKMESLQFLIGKVMEKTKGKANPQVAGEILRKQLEN